MHGIVKWKLKVFILLKDLWLDLKKCITWKWMKISNFFVQYNGLEKFVFFHIIDST